mmetsp:Transcript_36340/g.82381  ORF Transcript_36340/g.82381 Transcript_36340/m.82381 type:complete len:84 (+) Transcript_36340:86-337(+)
MHGHHVAEQAAQSNSIQNSAFSRRRWGKANAGSASRPRHRWDPNFAVLHPPAPDVSVAGVVGRTELPVSERELDPIADVPQLG